MQVGDKVAYSVQFLRSIRMSHSDMARGRGFIEHLQKFGETTLAEVVWDHGADLPRRINTANLAKVGANSKFCQC